MSRDATTASSPVKLLDLGLPALLEDLDERGLLKDVAVVVWSNRRTGCAAALLELLELVKAKGGKKAR